MDQPVQPQSDASVGSVNPTAPAQTTMPAPSRATVGTRFQMRTEIPAVPNASVVAFNVPPVDEKAAGNFEFTTELLDCGYTGYWRERVQTTPAYQSVTIDPTLWVNAIYRTLYFHMIRNLTLKTEMPNEAIAARISATAQVLAVGCSTVTYLKLRNLTISDFPGHYNQAQLWRPRASDNLAVPSGFAFAIQQLGLVNVADSAEERIIVPQFPDEGHTYGIPTGYLSIWNPNTYAQAVEYARNIGVTFSMVDLKKKEGTAWWLLRQVYEDNVFELHCTIPEVNFTKAMALTHSMFLIGEQDNPSQAFVDLTPVGNETYGIMLRNPHHGINVSSYEAVSQEAKEVFEHV